jgi:hypothetical protein
LPLTLTAAVRGVEAVAEEVVAVEAGAVNTAAVEAVATNMVAVEEVPVNTVAAVMVGKLVPEGRATAPVRALQAVMAQALALLR